MNLAMLVLTDDAVSELERFITLTHYTDGVHLEFNPLHRVAVGVLKSIEDEAAVGIRSTKELEQEKEK